MRTEYKLIKLRFYVEHSLLTQPIALFQDAIPKEMLRVIEGCWNPAIILVAIEHGWDLFDGSYPTKLSNAGLVLTLNFDPDRPITEPCILDLNDERYV